MSITEKNNYWGFWATLLLGLLIFLLFSIIQALGIFAYIFSVDPQAVSVLSSTNPGVGLSGLLNQYLFSGDAIAVAEIPAAFIGVLLICWFAWMRKPLTIEEYLDLNMPSIKSVLVFLGLLILAIVLMETINHVLDRPVPEFMTRVYSNTNNLPLFWVAVVIAAPFFEEFLFRGFLLEGFGRSKLGMPAAVIITSAIWAVIHMQYGWFEIISIFFIGILLCIAKIKTKSLYVPIAMHLLMNLTASIGMEFTQ